jgi:hypothetical protein
MGRWITADDVRGGDYVEVWAVRASKADAADGVMITWTDIAPDAYDAMLDRAARHAGYSVSSRDYLETRAHDMCLQQTQHQKPQQSGMRVWQRTLVRARIVTGLPIQIRTFQRCHRSLAAFPCDSPESAVTVKVRRLELRMHARARLVFETRTSAASSCYRQAFIEIALVPGQTTLPDDLMHTVENSVRVVFLGHSGKRGPIR